MIDYLKLPFECGYVTDITPFVNSAGRINQFNGMLVFALCTRGSATIQVDDQPFSINRHDAFFLLPSSSSIVLQHSPDLTCYLLRADYDYYFQIMDGILDVKTQIQMGHYPYLTLNEQQVSTLLPLMHTLHERITAENRGDLSSEHYNLSRKLIISMCNTVAYELLRIYISRMQQQIEVVEITRKEQIAREFITLVLTQFAQHRDIAYYADKMCLSTHYLSSVVKQSTGVNASDLIRERVIGEAKRMLDGSAMSIKEISIRLNFPNQSFFGKYFKQYTGISPQRYRSDKRAPAGA